MGRHANKSTDEMLRTVLAVLRGDVTLAEAGRRAGVADMTVANWRDRSIECARYMQGHPLSIPVMARGNQGEDSLP